MKGLFNKALLTELENLIIESVSLKYIKSIGERYSILKQSFYERYLNTINKVQNFRLIHDHSPF